MKTISRTVLAGTIALFFALAPFMAYAGPGPKANLSAAAVLDIGPGAIVRSSSAFGDNTIVDLANPADADGTIDTVQIYAWAFPLTDVEVAIFSSPDNIAFTSWDSVKLGTVSANGVQTFTGLSLTVHQGDYIGLYFKGLIYASLIGEGTYFRSAPGNAIPCTNQVFYSGDPGKDISIYGTGTATAGAGSSNTSLTSFPNPAAQGQPVTFTANVSAVPPASGNVSGSVTFRDGASPFGSANLTSSGIASFTTSSLASGNHTIMAEYSGDTSFNGSISEPLIQQILPAQPAGITVSLTAGWNMVSVPVELSNNSTNSVFPEVIAVFSWDPVSKTYVVPTTIEPSNGYWVAVASNTTLVLTGNPASTWSSNTTAGWNMIGSVSANASFASPNDNPDDSVMPPLYWYDPVTKSYETAEVIEPGKGYWVAAVRDCTLTLP